LKTLPIVRWQTAPIRSTIFLAVHNMNSVSQHKGKPSGPPFISVRPCCEGGSGFELVAAVTQYFQRAFFFTSGMRAVGGRA
jgi:hypothetical protein